MSMCPKACTHPVAKACRSRLKIHDNMSDFQNIPLISELITNLWTLFLYQYHHINLFNSLDIVSSVTNRPIWSCKMAQNSSDFGEHVEQELDGRIRELLEILVWMPPIQVHISSSMRNFFPAYPFSIQ